jgi:hypothetical protein
MVSESTLEEGQALLRLAVNAVALMAANPDGVETFEAQFPWAADHMDDPGQAGSPPCAASVLALYWQSVWARLHGESSPLMLATYPPDDGTLHPREVGRVESRISLVVAEAVHEDSLDSDDFVLTAEDGTVVPVNAWLFYRDMSHVVHLAPESTLREDTWYTLGVGPGIRTIDGQTTLGDWTLTFTTGAPPVDTGPSTTDTAPPDDSSLAAPDESTQPKDADACGGCGQAGRAADRRLVGFAFFALCTAYRRRSWRS